VNRYDVVTFDMGATLVRFFPSEDDLYLAAFHAAGLRPDPAALRRARDLAWREYFESAGCATFEPSEARDREIEESMTRRVLGHLGLDAPQLVQPLQAAIKAAFKEPGAVRVYPEVIDVLQSLRARGYRLGIISNWSWDLHEYVEQVGLTGYFGAIVASARAGCDKPHPGIFLQALQALNSPPDRAMHVGDSYAADVVGALGVGMGALWLDRAGCGGRPECQAIRDLSEVLHFV
jgi:putative hydrolase of the HAD superfamily